MKNKLKMILMATAFVPMLAMSAHAADVVVDDGAFIPSAENGDGSNTDVDIPDGGLHVVDGLDVADAGSAGDSGDAGDLGDKGDVDVPDAVIVEGDDVPTHEDIDIGIACCVNPDEAVEKDADIPDDAVMMTTMSDGMDVPAVEAPEANDAAAQVEVPEIREPSTEKYNN